MIKAPSQISYEFGPFRLDAAERVLRRRGDIVTLAPKAFETLLVLVESRGRVVGKDELLNRVWPDAFVEEANIAVNVSILRKALGERPDGDGYIETIPKRGYRFKAEIRERADAVFDEPFADDAVSPAAEVVAPPPARRPRALPLVVGAAVLALLAFAGILALRTFRAAEKDPGDPPRHVAVLPFRNLKPDADADFLGFSLADSIIAKLGYARSLIVRPSSYVEKYRNREIDPQKVADELDVEAILTGSYMRDGDDLRIVAQLADVRSREILWQETVTLKYDRLLDVQDSVAQKVIQGLHVRLAAEEAQRLRRDLPADPAAYEAYLRGVDLRHRVTDDLAPAIAMFQKSVELDSGYAPAWAHLGALYTTVGSVGFGGAPYYERAQAAFERALAIHPEQTEARMFFANLLTETNRVERALPMLRAAVRDNPNLAQGHWELAYACRYAGLVEESIAEGEIARRLEPEARANASVFTAYLYAGRYDRFLQTLPERPDSGYIAFYRGLGHLHLRDDARAIDEFERAARLAPNLLHAQIGLAFRCALVGERERGRALLRATEEKLRAHGAADPEGVYKIAQAYAALNDRAAALRLFRASVEGGFFCHSYFVADPLLENVRSEPEFAAIAESARKRHQAVARASGDVL